MRRHDLDDFVRGVLVVSDFSDEAPELLVAEIRARHRLTSFHIFDQGGEWRVFAFRNDPRGYQASVEQGSGPNIVAALEQLDQRLIEGPIHKTPTP